MLSESFVLLPAVRLTKERAIWNQGISSWQDFLSREKIKGLGTARKERCDNLLRIADRNLRQKNGLYFSNALRFCDQWRLYETFKDEAVYLDIETDGYYGGITVVGLSDGVQTKTLVRGFNLDKELLRRELSHYQLLVTFNGKSFDVPVLERYFGFRIGMPHVDLRFVCAKAGHTGGLKAIEKQLGIKRREEVCAISGEDAVYLWEMWKSTGNREYLEKLVIYNEEDILNLRPLSAKMIPAAWERVRQVPLRPSQTG
ncbi:MAG TPA: ribonuclease H-like domain-containing protein [Candidatus Nanoarchaeia archaeon]|nr:ribonuclease H-like domain-containing protein [Candidatus Nanoarchaeia archaeon]